MAMGEAPGFTQPVQRIHGAPDDVAVVPVHFLDVADRHRRGVHILHLQGGGDALGDAFSRAMSRRIRDEHLALHR